MKRPFTKTDNVSLAAKVEELTAQVAELQARMSVVDGRSLLNAERNVRTHSFLQNLAEDFELTTQEVRQLVNEPTATEETESDET